MAAEVEHALGAAKERGDWDEYLRVLAGARWLVLDAPKALVDGGAREVPLLPWRDAEGRNCLIVRTPGEALGRRGEIVTVAEDFRWVLKKWPPQSEWLLVNPGTATEAYFSGAPAFRQRYAQLAQGVPEQKKRFPDVLVSDFDGPLHGPVAQALACGAHLAVHNGVAWNGSPDVYKDYRSDTRILRDGWGTTSRGQWIDVLDGLLNGRTSAAAEFVLGVRRKLAWGVQHQGPVDPKLWRHEIASALRPTGMPSRQAKEAEELVPRVLRYEESLLSDGLLPPGGFVGSVLAYDYGRAVNVARLGVSAGFGEPGEAEGAIMRASELIRQSYRSWEEFSAGYVLGRVLAFDDEAFGKYYAGALAAHRVLTQDPASPWRNLPFA
jgi:hypothetical protein